MSAVLSVVATSMTTALAATQSISTAGPLTKIEISDTLSCAVNHAGDPANEFSGGSGCGTFLAIDGKVFRPADLSGSVAGSVAFTPFSQSSVMGSGTTADPFSIVTVVDAPGANIRLTETDTYVQGDESYRTDIKVDNPGTPRGFTLYRAGDCKLAGSESGFGARDVPAGAVACVNSVQGAPGPRVLQWRPITGGTHNIEGNFSDVWAAVASGQQFPDTCQCGTVVDNGGGLSWSSTLGQGASTTFSSLIAFSTNALTPLTMSKTADVASVIPQAPDGYTITVNNPTAADVVINTISDTLPPNFTYISGTTTGVTTNNPTSINGQVVTWTGPFTVPASGSVTLHFGVTASGVLGNYFNRATADAGPLTVVATGDTALVTVTLSPVTTTTTSTTSTTVAGGGNGTTTTTTVAGGGGGTTSTTVAGGGSGSTTTTVAGGGGDTTTTTTAGGSDTTSTTTGSGSGSGSGAGSGSGSGGATTTTIGGALARTGTGSRHTVAFAAVVSGVGGAFLFFGTPILVGPRRRLKKGPWTS